LNGTKTSSEPACEERTGETAAVILNSIGDGPSGADPPLTRHVALTILSVESAQFKEYMKKTKTQKKREKRTRKERRLKTLEASENQFVIEAVDGIEIAYANRAFDDIVTEKSTQHITNLSRIAARQFRREGRGSFLIISEANPNEAVYLAAQKLSDCIEQVIPEALSHVQKTINDYNPQEQFVVINVLSQKRIAITTDVLRFVT
jgi:hypothetical protein